LKVALVLGCGYVGQRIGKRLSEMGLRVVGSTRSLERAAQLEAAGVEPLVGQLSDSKTLKQVRQLGTDEVVYLVPPTTDGKDPLRSVLDVAGRAGLQAFVYVSSTSVYGDRGGEWVDESTPVDPAGVGLARYEAERAVIEAARAGRVPGRVCRVTGIYGPGRTLRALLESGEYVLVREGDAWVNRIHVDDLVTALLASLRGGTDGQLYNLADDEPHRTSEFANLAADLQGLNRPRWVSETEANELLGEVRLRRKLDSKRVRNASMKDELGVRLAYPSYRTGLPAAVAATGAR
jgi:nucleoside-diphosphate-sugar epimerase